MWGKESNECQMISKNKMWTMPSISAVQIEDSEDAFEIFFIFKQDLSQWKEIELLQYNAEDEHRTKTKTMFKQTTFFFVFLDFMRNDWQENVQIWCKKKCWIFLVFWKVAY